MANKEKARLTDLKNEKQEELFKHLLKIKKNAEKNYTEVFTQYLLAKTEPEANAIIRHTTLPWPSRNIFKKLDNNDKKLYILFYTKLYEETKLIQFYHKTVESLFEFRLFWKNDISDFKSKSNNTERQFSELIHFLFSKYKLPAFAVNVWKNITRQPHDLAWFFHIADGKNLKKADFLPFTLTNKQIVHMLDAPDDFTFTQAMVWGLMGLIGINNRNVKDEVCAHNISKTGHNMEFWSSVFIFINNMGFLEQSQIRPLLDYIHSQKYALNAPHPNFSMKNRNPATLMNEMEAWHAEQRRIERNLERDRKKYNLKEIPKKWDKSFEIWEKKNANGKPTNPVWSIIELTTLSELSEEGSDLHHCVRSYHSRCALGSTAILSLRKNGKSIATIEVYKKMKEIVQARGFGNKPVDTFEKSMIQEWAYLNNIYVSRML